MAKGKGIDIQKEVSKIWEQAKVNLSHLGEKTVRLARRGEKELVRASKIGKLQLDIVGLNMKKDDTFKEIGKKMFELQKKGKASAAKFTGSFNQIDAYNRQIEEKKSQINKLRA